MSPEIPARTQDRFRVRVQRRYISSEHADIPRVAECGTGRDSVKCKKRTTSLHGEHTNRRICVTQSGELHKVKLRPQDLRLSTTWKLHVTFVDQLGESTAMHCNPSIVLIWLKPTLAPAWLRAWRYSIPIPFKASRDVNWVTR